MSTDTQFFAGTDQIVAAHHAKPKPKPRKAKRPQKAVEKALRDELAQVKEELDITKALAAVFERRTIEYIQHNLRTAGKVSFKAQMSDEPDTDAAFLANTKAAELKCQLITLAMFTDLQNNIELHAKLHTPAQEWFASLQSLEEKTTDEAYSMYEDGMMLTDKIERQEDPVAYDARMAAAAESSEDDDMSLYYHEKDRLRMWYGSDEGQAYLAEQAALEADPVYVAKRDAKLAASSSEFSKWIDDYEASLS